MANKVREFIDYWIKNSVHPAEQYQTRGASQDVHDLTGSCLRAALGEGISERDIDAEIGDLSRYIKDALGAANKAERDRQTPN